MLQFGYNTGVINAPGKNIENFMKDVYKDRYNEEVSEEYIKQLRSVVVSIFAIGGMLGGFSGGWMANRFGRKGGLLLNNVLGIAGGCLMGSTKISHSYEMLFVGRFIIGLNCGKLHSIRGRIQTGGSRSSERTFMRSTKKEETLEYFLFALRCISCMLMLSISLSHSTIRIKYITCTYVRIGNSTIKFKRWLRYSESIGCDHRFIIISSVGC